MAAPQLSHSFADALPEMAVEVEPTEFPKPELAVLNEPLARELGLDVGWLRTDDGIAWLAGSSGGHATAYAGHQFGQFVPVLGDGRALLLGDLTDSEGQRREIQLKGSGRTPFSRPGSDGRGAIGPMLREYMVSEFMHAVGIPTTRSLAVLSTGETVQRQFGPEAGGILVRVARSHLRIGSVQYACGAGSDLTQRVVEFAGFDTGEDMLSAVTQRQFSTVADWMAVGFVHGVMNTDNASISGETLDYGPCAFTETFRPGDVYSSIDRGGRYAFGQQPNIAAWNLTRLAEALIPVTDPNVLADVLSGMQEAWDTAWDAASVPEPLFVPRNHMVEAAVGLAEKNRDFHSYNELLAAVTDPYNPNAGPEWMAQPEGDRAYVTFCGT